MLHNVFYIVKSKLLNKYLNEIDIFALLLSALCHDVDHTGRTNAFEASSYSNLAVKYNDEAILENHHSATTFKIMMEEDFNILSNFTAENFKYIRKIIISNILHTDMKKHFESLNGFEAKYPEFMQNPEGLGNFKINLLK